MKIRTKIANWLYKKYGTRDVVAMTREQMFGVDLNLTDIDFNEFSVEEKLAIADGAREIINSPVFKMAVDMVKERFMRHARDMADGELQMFCDRFSINGASMVWEEVKYMSELDDSKQEKTNTPFNLMET